MKEFQTGYLVTKQGRHHFGCLRSLNGKRIDVRLLDGDVKAATDGEAFDIQQQIAVRDRQPEAIFGQFQQHRIIQHATTLAGENDGNARCRVVVTVPHA